MKYLLQSLSLFPRGLDGTFLVDVVKKSGFDGIELVNLINKRGPAYITELKKRCDDAGLILHIHQVWSYEDNPREIVNKVFKPLRFIRKESGHLREQFGDHLDSYIPKIVYADHISSAIIWNTSEVWLQTCSVQRQGQLKTAYKVFRECVLKSLLPVVFDNQHQLEYRNGLLDITGLPTDGQSLLEQSIADWDMFHEQGLIREMHLCDFDPRRGMKGRNVELGTGVFPLSEFVQHVFDSGWDGFVVPEVKPRLSHLTKWQLIKRFSTLNQYVRGLFEHRVPVGATLLK